MQKTLQGPVSIKGKGLHTGYEVGVTFNPAPENHGYKFKRIDLEGLFRPKSPLSTRFSRFFLYWTIMDTFSS